MSREWTPEQLGAANASLQAIHASFAAERAKRLRLEGVDPDGYAYALLRGLDDAPVSIQIESPHSVNDDPQSGIDLTRDQALELGVAILRLWAELYDADTAERVEQSERFDWPVLRQPPPGLGLSMAVLELFGIPTDEVTDVLLSTISPDDDGELGGVFVRNRATDEQWRRHELEP